MARNTKSALPPAAAPDWREQAEAAGRAAFETATEPQPTPEPALAWLQKQSPRKKESMKKALQQKSTTPAAAPAPATQPSAPKATEPDWVKTTPKGKAENQGEAGDSYHLAMFHDAVSTQVVYVTRDEYIGLKHHLSGMRGL
jgi:hypothetical protein